MVQSFDGLAARFLDQVPSLRRLKEEALHTPFMRPVYPSSTFPNHYSIVTGLYPESHGIIDNTFSDYSNTTFVHYTQVRLDNKWWKGTPIWQLAQEQGLRVFTHYWPGSDVSDDPNRSWGYFVEFQLARDMINLFFITLFLFLVYFLFGSFYYLLLRKNSKKTEKL